MAFVEGQEEGSPQEEAPAGSPEAEGMQGEEPQPQPQEMECEETCVLHIFPQGDSLVEESVSEGQDSGMASVEITGATPGRRSVKVEPAGTSVGTTGVSEANTQTPEEEETLSPETRRLIEVHVGQLLRGYIGTCVANIMELIPTSPDRAHAMADLASLFDLMLMDRVDSAVNRAVNAALNAYSDAMEEQLL